MYDQYNWSRDGGESRYDEPDMRVTGFNLKEATADEMFQRGGEQTTLGIVCKTTVIDSPYKRNGDEWTHIRWTDEQFCDKTKNCEAGLDELEGCQRPVVVVIVTGSNGRDGVFIKTTTSDIYKQMDRSNIIFKAANNRWVIADGPNLQNATVHFKARESNTTLVESSWENVFDEVEREGQSYRKSELDLHIIRAPIQPKYDKVQTERGFACKSADQANKWFWMPGSKCDEECEERK